MLGIKYFHNKTFLFKKINQNVFFVKTAIHHAFETEYLKFFG